MTTREPEHHPVAGRSAHPAPLATTPPLLTVLVADPSPQACRALIRVCADEDVALVQSTDGASALFQAGRLAPDLVLVSAQLPVLSAPQLIAAIRRHAAVPIVLGIDAGQSEGAAPAVAAGAGEVVSRPYRAKDMSTLLREHLARAQARHSREATLTVGALELNGAAYSVRVLGQPLDLPLRDFELLRLLMQHADRVVRAEQIREHVWRGETATSNTIAVHVRRLRLALRGAAEIVSIRGVGYRLACEPATAPGAVQLAQ